MKNLIFVKLGGSLITDKSRPYTVKEDVIKRLCREIHETREERDFSLLVGHGGGSFPHVSAKKYETHKGIINEKSWEGFSKVHDDAARLNRIVVSSLIKAGEKAVSMQPSASCIAESGRITEWFTTPIETALNKGLLPVPYGDACLDRAKGCCIISTEEIFRFLAEKFKPERIIIVGKTDGVYDSEGKVIKEITKANLKEVEKSIQGSDGIADVTGGMIIKVRKALEMGTDVEIINGLKKGFLKKALAGDAVPGTCIKGK